ncbi:hypothetical protein C7446_2567 [Kushneria sinocarnis]|uniref:Uncharacterized protein n=1 Tax=Kushneria sinocarnis TaxID=595502 RepID=A0A420WUM3_9GAMM|nr:hypothetical protein [Kushneria sinocarnis]RKQ97147.1 hypothetical protein C7446_2567 [Kushneria sinocarnis]
MAVSDRIDQRLRAAFADPDRLGEAYKPFTAERRESGGYVPGEGQQPDSITSYSGNYWQAQFTFSQLQTLDLDSADIRIGMLSSDVEKAPQLDDTLTLDDGTTARVTEVEPNTIGVTYMIRLRVNG